MTPLPNPRLESDALMRAAQAQRSHRFAVRTSRSTRLFAPSIGRHAPIARAKSRSTRAL